MPRRLKGRDALEALKRYTPRLRWCPVCGLPVLGRERCPRCGGSTLEVKLAPPGDLRPAWPVERERLWKAALEGLGREAARRLLGGPWALALLNPVQSIDAGYEVIVDGHTVAGFFYDPAGDRWLLRPDRVGVEILAAEETGPVLYTSTMLRPGAVLREGLQGEKQPPGSYVALAGRGLSYGIGRVLGDGTVRVVKTWRRRRRVRWRHRPRARSLDEVVEANRGWLEEREEEARGWLEKVIRETGARPLASVSGGKDSTVSASIAVQAGVEDLYTVDTGIEHPETLETFEKLARALGARLHVARAASRMFWRGIEFYGPPARDYRWCTKLLKMAPLARLLGELAPGGRVLMVTGQRGAESTQRALSPRLAESGTAGRGRSLVAAPIQWWSSLEVFLYIRLRGLPLNPLYTLGFDRIGCWMCPASHLCELRETARRHPELWEKWEMFLRRYAQRHGLPQSWVELGLWRWRWSFPAEARRLASQAGLDPDTVLRRLNTRGTAAAREYSREGELLVASPSLPGSLDWCKIPGLAKATGLAHSVDKESATLLDGRSWARVTRNGRVEVPAKAPPGPRRRLARLAASILLMASACAGEHCMLCASSCPEDAVRGPAVIDPEKCTGCRACINACPATNAAEQVVQLVESLAQES